MAKILNKVDIVTVGVGLTSGIVAKEATKAGLNVVGLERGEYRESGDFEHLHDEWRYAINCQLAQDLSKETITFRNSEEMLALPMRRLGSFLVADGLGGAFVHWNGMNFRFLPYDFEIKTMTDKRYGKDKLNKDYLLQDWALTYDQIEPYFNRFEKTIGCSGENISPFNGKRSEPYPLPPLPKTKAMKMFEDAAKKGGFNPYVIPAGIASQPYTTPDGGELNPCMFCGFCERFACEFDAKAMPSNVLLPMAVSTGKFDIRCNSNVVEIIKKGNKVTGVRYVNTITREEFIQPADIVMLGTYVLNNAKLLMVSNIGQQYDPKTGKGTLGRNYCYQVVSGATGFFKDEMNLYSGAGALGMCIDDFNGDNFDHSKLDFIHGAMVSVLQTGKRPIANNATPPGTPSWGADFKRESVYWHNRTLSLSGQGASMPHKNNYLSLDSTYKDAYGVPLLKMTYNFTDQDRALHKHLSGKIREILQSMGATQLAGGSTLGDSAKGSTLGDYNIVPYQTTHNTGGTVSGNDPATSVVNSYMQHWDAENLFVVGASNFAHNSGYNPTGTVGALAYRCAEGIIKYSKKGGMLV